MRRSAWLFLMAPLGLAACAYDGDGPLYGGTEWVARMPYEGGLTGPGVATLDDWLKGTREGRTIVTMGWREAGNGFVSEDVANRANIWFRRYADQNGDMTITDPEIRIALATAAGRWTGGPEPGAPRTGGPGN